MFISVLHSAKYSRISTQAYGGSILRHFKTLHTNLMIFLDRGVSPIHNPTDMIHNTSDVKTVG
jgi:hypothetical protein